MADGLSRTIFNSEACEPTSKIEEDLQRLEDEGPKWIWKDGKGGYLEWLNTYPLSRPAEGSTRARSPARNFCSVCYISKGTRVLQFPVVFSNPPLPQRLQGALRTTEAQQVCKCLMKSFCKALETATAGNRAACCEKQHHDLYRHIKRDHPPSPHDPLNSPGLTSFTTSIWAS